MSHDKSHGHDGVDGSGVVSHDSLTNVDATDHHDNANDPTTAQKAALVGTSGAPGASNKYVTDVDPRLSLASKGVPGFDGMDGDEGPMGFPGPMGLQGPIGPTGTQGTSGLQGPPGFDGLDGEEGPQGLPGTPGLQGIQGVQGVQGLQGPPGFSGVDGDEGPQGPPGQQGIQGIQGITGATGASGPMGPPGSSGEDGDEGPMGFPGSTGATGAQGTPGTAGAQGIPGIPGPPGYDADDPEMPYIIPGPKGDTGAAGTSGGGNTGTATIDFGAFPGASDASLAITGQAAIVAGSIVEAWLRPAATADHTADEHIVETLGVFAGNIVAGTGFTIYGVNTGQINEPANLPHSGETFVIAGVGGALPKQQQPGAITDFAGKGTRIYGAWSVQWRWS